MPAFIEIAETSSLKGIC